jgi:hypothetical protein
MRLPAETTTAMLLTAELTAAQQKATAKTATDTRTSLTNEKRIPTSPSEQILVEYDLAWKVLQVSDWNK